VARYTYQNMIIDSSAAFLRNVAFDASVFLKGDTYISNIGTSIIGTPYALVTDSSDSTVIMKTIQLNTMAFESSSNYYTKTQTDEFVSNLEASFGNLYLKESSLGNDFYFETGLLEVSIGSIGGDYATNASVNLLATTINASIGLMATNSSVGLALGVYATNASISLAGFATNASVNLLTTTINASIGLRLKEASIGSGFTWNAGMLDVSGGGDVTKAYVDASLAKYFPEASLNDSYFNWVGGYLEPSVAGGTGDVTKAYVDGSLATLNASVNTALGAYATNVSVGLARFVKEVSLGTDFAWQGGYLTTIDSSSETASRTIYVDASVGSDTTGDGSVGGLPYATIGKALTTVKKTISPSITTTISISSGTFTLSNNDLNVLSSISGTGTLLLNGSISLVKSGFTMGNYQALDPLTYDVSGGDSSTWTTNQWRGSFLKSGSLYYPITHNTSTNLSLTSQVTGTEIYTSSTIINLPGKDLMINVVTKFKNVQIILGGTLSFDGPSPLILLNVFINCSVQRALQAGIYQVTNALFQILRSCFYNCTIYCKNGKYLPSTDAYIYQNSSHGVLIINELTQYIINLVLEQTSSGTDSGGLDLEFSGIFRPYTTSWLKLINCNVGIIYSSNIELKGTSGASLNIILVNTNYLFKKNSIVTSDYIKSTILPYSNFYGTPVIRWFYDPMYEFVNLTSGRNIQIIGLVYPEFDQNQSSKLTNNAITDISIGSVLQNKSLSLSYTLSRSVGYAEGTFNIMTDGSALYPSIDRYTSSGNLCVEDPAVTFDAIVDASIIKLRATLDSSGGDASLNYNISRVMKTPLVI